MCVECGVHGKGKLMYKLIMHDQEISLFDIEIYLAGHLIEKCISRHVYKYRLGYVKGGSTAFKVQKDGCGIPSAARVLLGSEGL